MSEKQVANRKWLRRAGEGMFLALVLLLLFNPGAKGWLLRQLLVVGLFRPEIKKEVPVANLPAGATAFSFRDATGAIRSTNDLRGKVVFINFWATWCPPCIAEMPALNDLYHQLRVDERIVFLFINEDEDAAKATAFLKEEGYAFPMVTRGGSVPAAIYGGTLPTTIILNKEGNLVFRHEGLAKYNSKTFVEQLRALF